MQKEEKRSLILAIQISANLLSKQITLLEKELKKAAYTSTELKKTLDILKETYKH